MTLIRHILTTTLAALILVIGTLQLAHAKGMAPTVDHMIICAGHGVVTIGLDADGNPTGEVFYCPDCASSVIALPVTGYPTPEADIQRFSVTDVIVTTIYAPSFSPPSPPARGPPLFV